MIKIARYGPFFILLLSLSASKGSTPCSLDTLAAWMTGSFSSERQAQSDSNFYHIVLHMVPIWTHRTDAKWLYVEQAVATHPDQPYRQRIYHLSSETETRCISEIYEIPSPLRFAGAWKKQNPLANFSADSLVKREGCRVYIERVNDSMFIGKTDERQCQSSHRGAIYATTEVTITRNKLVSWDRGYDESDNQVWGSEYGGYVFEKIKKE
ncbi:hypothetical protein GF406_17485 [candidate division KSB1 bacterium]|nr:hypothetical protein [candidate division KSB1 bacterium]